MHVLFGISWHLGMFPFQIHHLNVKFQFLFMYGYMYIHTVQYYAMKHVSFGPHLIQQILVSGRQWSVLSSSIVASTHDLYIVHCIVHEICTYCTLFTVLYR